MAAAATAATAATAVAAATVEITAPASTSAGEAIITIYGAHVAPHLIGAVGINWLVRARHCFNPHSAPSPLNLLLLPNKRHNKIPRQIPSYILSASATRRGYAPGVRNDGITPGCIMQPAILRPALTPKSASIIEYLPVACFDSFEAGARVHRYRCAGHRHPNIRAASCRHWSFTCSRIEAISILDSP